ncbi:MAG TPA: hypothetical protein VLV18_08550 [Terriglobales bacterium]|nr:hypothetical protein [Terriglobales bacterium]
MKTALNTKRLKSRRSTAAHCRFSGEAEGADKNLTAPDILKIAISVIAEPWAHRILHSLCEAKR